MIVALYILAALVSVGAVLYLLECRHRHISASKPDNIELPADDTPADAGDDNGECCGMHITCERDSLLASVSQQIDYYDDEELDIYAGRDADAYTDSEIEQFRDILLTLLPGDIAGWARSVQLRGITLPTPIRDELLMIVGEARSAGVTAKAG